MIPTIFAKILALLGVAVLLVKAENDYGTVTVKNYIKNLILPSPNQHLSLGSITQDSISLFNKIFGKDHISGRCFGYSAFFTIIFSIISFFSISIFYSSFDLTMMIRTLIFKENIFYIFLAMLASIVIDYISLIETRYFLGWVNEDMNLFKIICLLILDALLSFAIFVLLFSFFKTMLDMSLLPRSYEYNKLLINHGNGSAVELSSSIGFLNNSATYYVSVVKYSIWSAFSIFKDSFTSYWFSSMYIDGRNLYVLPCSTMWATTHLSSIYIYLGISIYGIGRISSLFNLRRYSNIIKKLMFLYYFNLDPSNNPITISILNTVMYYYVIVFAIFIYKLY